MDTLTQLIATTAQLCGCARDDVGCPRVLGPLSAMTLTSEVLGPRCSVEQLGLSLVVSCTALDPTIAPVPAAWRSQALAAREARLGLEGAVEHGGVLTAPLPALSPAAQNALLVVWWQRLTQAGSSADSGRQVCELLVASQLLAVCTAAAESLRQLLEEAIASPIL